MTIPVPNSEVLARILREHNIPIQTWNQGKAKSLVDLMEEITAGESTLEVINGVLTRSVRVALVDVFFQKLKLKESKQEFADGRVRERNMETSVNEKLLGGEDPVVGARRGVKEELGFQELLYLEPGEVKIETIESPSYPGLTAKFERHFFSIYLMTHLYKKEGYIEDDGRKKTFFVWVPVSTTS